jgi:hypothetical protein
MLCRLCNRTLEPGEPYIPVITIGNWVEGAWVNKVEAAICMVCDGRNKKEKQDAAKV